MAYGVTSTGFVDKPLETILSEIEAAEKASFGNEFDVSAQSPAGQLNSVMATQLRSLWEVAQAIYSSLDPDLATGEALGALSSLTGTVRDSATYSTVTATVNLDAGVTLPAGSIASVSGNPDARFATTADATNSGGAPADVSVAMQAEDTGPVVANAGTLTVIETTYTGWNTVTNALDATLGDVVESDEDLRLRREVELRRTGAAAVDAIRADVLDVTGVTSCTVFENDTDITDGDGVPPHSIEAVVLGGTANDIAQALWDSVAAGIRTYGSSSGTATDDLGDTHTVYFSRPTEVDIYIDVELTEGDDYPTDGDTQVKEAVVAWGDALAVGEDVVLTQIYPEVFSVDGVEDVTLIELDTVTPPTGLVNLVIGSRQLAVFDTSRVRVTST